MASARRGTGPAQRAGRLSGPVSQRAAPLVTRPAHRSASGPPASAFTGQRYSAAGLATAPGPPRVRRGAWPLPKSLPTSSTNSKGCPEDGAGAAELLQTYSDVRLEHVNTKCSPTDLVSEADRASEAFIVSELRRARPGDDPC